MVGCDGDQLLDLILVSQSDGITAHASAEAALDGSSMRKGIDIPVRQSDEGEEAVAELFGGDFTIANFFPFSEFFCDSGLVG
jgi:hypothetical protein